MFQGVYKETKGMKWVKEIDFLWKTLLQFKQVNIGSNKYIFEILATYW